MKLLARRRRKFRACAEFRKGEQDWIGGREGSGDRPPSRPFQLVCGQPKGIDAQGWCATSCSTSSMISAARAAQGFSQHEQGGDGWLVDAPFGQKAPILAEFVAQASIAPGWFPGQNMRIFRACAESVETAIGIEWVFHAIRPNPNSRVHQFTPQTGY